ncbi:MAG TPA: hypothetical protein VGS27_33605 [Candidatus Sulfotelmatobacter sp.]|nr:hypothetical protein [Candidatus Sulfotelmatobacter sp.]
MSDADRQQREHELGERIARQMRSIGQSAGKPVTADEQQKLKAAASRLDQMLKTVADADKVALKDAAARLDKLLVDIAKGKDFSNRLKRGSDRNR